MSGLFSHRPACYVRCIVNPTPPLIADRPKPPSPDLLRRALGRALRPLVRLAIQGGVTFPAVCDVLRGLFVEVAMSELPDKRAQTDSRISLMTGVHRKEIRRQRLQESAAEPTATTLSSQVIARWLGSPALTGPDGAPLPLPRLGAAPSFEALVSAVTTDVRPRALLDTWLDQGIAQLDLEGRVVLASAAFIPQADRETQLFYFARNLHDHAAAAAANVVAAGTPPFLDRSVHYDGLSAEAAAAIAAVAREAGVAALLEVNRRALVIADADDLVAPTTGAPRHRVNLGLYLLTEQEAPRAED